MIRPPAIDWPRLLGDDLPGTTAREPTPLGMLAADLDRRARLLRVGWPEGEAERLAERLVKRDREADPRVSCAECRHYRPGRCANYRVAGLFTAEVGRDLAATLQRCRGFDPR